MFEIFFHSKLDKPKIIIKVINHDNIIVFIKFNKHVSYIGILFLRRMCSFNSSSMQYSETNFTSGCLCTRVSKMSNSQVVRYNEITRFPLEVIK